MVLATSSNFCLSEQFLSKLGLEHISNTIKFDDSPSPERNSSYANFLSAYQPKGKLIRKI